MKKVILAAGLLSGVVGLAQAQTNVTIYGVIDTGINYTNNVPSTTGHSSNIEMVSGEAQGSRFGFKGNEDLGGGLSAVFQLENGFNSANGNLGQGKLLFGRQAFVGLSSKTAGTVTLGRQYDSIVDFIGPLTANGNWAGFMFSHPLDNDNTDNSFRVNNTVKYTSPTFSGLTFGGLYGFGQTAGNNTENRAYSLGASYINGPISAALGYMNLTSPASTTGGAISTNTDGNFLAAKQKVFGAGINWTLGAATLGFVYTNTVLNDPTANIGYLGNQSILPTNGSTLTLLKYNNYELNAKYQFTPAFYAGAMYTYTVGSYETTAGTPKPKWNEIGLMADYNFSKRTDVYVQGVYQKVGGDATGTVLDQAYVTTYSDSPSSNDKQVALRVALRHAF